MTHVLIHDNNNMEREKIIWKPNPPGNFTSKSTYIALSPQGQNFRWHNVNWGKWTQLKHNFLAWQVCTDASQTHEWLHKIGILDDPICSLCSSADENSRRVF